MLKGGLRFGTECSSNHGVFVSPKLIWKEQVRTTAYNKGHQPELRYGEQYHNKWVNEKGKNAWAAVLPGVVRISRQRRSHAWPKDATIPIADTAATSKTAVTPQSSDPNQLNDTRDFAKVPSFARFAEFREADLDFKPAKLHVVYRNKCMSGRPKYEKSIMVELQLDKPMYQMTVLKNTPEVNYKLWMVKHLVKVLPLTLPDGVPSQEYFKGFIMKPNGEFVQSRLQHDNYTRPRGRPELEKYVLLRSEHEDLMRHKWINGSLDGSLLPSHEYRKDGTENGITTTNFKYPVLTQNLHPLPGRATRH
ncbi:hypothetical protein RvY_19290 [Ramazzottius varieornatus]|uniref:Large ribosomal subunit protein uL30m n=1 Tax=Ramazzottius varieornatus TaxID=947166 RepID=A0A1D1WC75_RAMVA|nr:hypothetical protein RvY_19290 [Ramazzottius varieornatus]